MTDKDFAVSTVVGIPSIGAISKKPVYLISLEDSNHKKPHQKFIAIDKPDSQNGFIMVKGFFSNLTDEEIIKTFTDILTRTPKEDILDMWFPWERIISVRSLVFNANKVANLAR